ncbi:MAG: CotH kinase family protein [Clostridia bacterium]
MEKRSLALLIAAAVFLSACGAPQTPLPAAETPPPTEAPAAEAPATETTAAETPDFDPDLVGKLRISEIMMKNRATLAAPDGSFPDWIELQNVSDAPLSLEGWSLSDAPEKEPWPLPSLVLAPGECRLFFAGGGGTGEEEAPFSLSADETLCLYAPSGKPADSLVCPELSADVSFARNAEGDAAPTLWASPGHPNTDEGYEAFAFSLDPAGPLIINEVMTANPSHPAVRGAERKDWVEIKNISDREVALDDYFLWDGDHADEPFRLPPRTLKPGACTVIVCGGDGAEDAPFSLDAELDRLYLGTANALCDYLPLHDVPVDGSCGRLEGQNGFFFFLSPTPGEANGEGFRMVSASPVPSIPDGVYDGVDALSVSLSAPGKIYCSFNGTLPDVNNELPDGGLSLTKTTVLRACAVEEGKAPSRIVTLSYIINENHSLPVLSLAVDDPALFRSVYLKIYKDVELPGCFSLYDNGSRYSLDCGLKLSGSGSVMLAKKSFAVLFRGCYGDGTLDGDLFNSGVSKYASLQLRAGEAYPTTIIQSDLFQDLCLDMTDEVLTQHSKYCVLYINGEYYGIYCLKEKFSAQYYASLKGVSKSSVTMLKYPVAQDSSFARELLAFCREADLTDPAQYARFCDLVNVDSLIDWYLIEGLSGNPDIGGNLRVFRSTEDGGRWSFALYDLDWGFTEKTSFFRNLTGDNNYHTGQIQTIMNAAMRSEDFRDRILSRYASVYDTSLSNERFLEQLDAYERLLAPEIPRDRQRWASSEEIWRMKMDELRDFIRSSDPQRLAVEHFCEIWDISPRTRAEYFGW